MRDPQPDEVLTAQLQGRVIESVALARDPNKSIVGLRITTVAGSDGATVIDVTPDIVRYDQFSHDHILEIEVTD